MAAKPPPAQKLSVLGRSWFPCWWERTFHAIGAHFYDVNRTEVQKNPPARESADAQKAGQPSANGGKAAARAWSSRLKRERRQSRRSRLVVQPETRAAAKPPPALGRPAFCACGGKAAARAGRRKFEQIRRPRSRALAHRRFLWLIGGRFVRQSLKKLRGNIWQKSRLNIAEREPRTPQESASPELCEVFQILGGVRGAETARGERKCVRVPRC